MGYYTYITGGGEIRPPIDDSKLKDFHIDTGTEYGYFVFRQEPGDQTVGLRPDGSIGVIGTDPGFTRVDFGYEDSIKGYNVHEAFAALADHCDTHGVKLNAVFEGDGENSSDFWQVHIVDNQVESKSGEVTFDDTETKQAIMRSTMVNAIKDLDPTQIHGNIIPRKDGTRDLSCGGLPGCNTCQQERTLLNSLIWGT